MSDCIFCKIVNKEIPSQIVYEDDLLLAFNDIEPQAPVHVLVVPKRHIKDITAISEDDFDIIKEIFRVANKIAAEKGVEDGFRIVNNCGEKGGQSVGHLHFHLLGGRQMQWPPG